MKIKDYWKKKARKDKPAVAVGSVGAAVAIAAGMRAPRLKGEKPPVPQTASASVPPPGTPEPSREPKDAASAFTIP